MPEGHVIESQARRLNRMFKNRVVTVDSPQGRFDARSVSQRKLIKAEAFGKHLFLVFENDQVIHVHLGLYGKWTFGSGDAPVVRGQIRLRLQDEQGFAELRGPTKCELITLAQMREVIASAGVDPLRKNADPAKAWERVHRSKQSIGAILMQQDVFAGVGNIYRAEVLFRAGISPFRASHTLTRAEFDALWSDLVELMKYGVKYGRIDTVRPEHGPNAMGRDARVDRHGGEVYVYRRAGQECFVCGALVLQQDLQGRKLYWCGVCQDA